jgi:hypothetical protein
MDEEPIVGTKRAFELANGDDEDEEEEEEEQKRKEKDEEDEDEDDDDDDDGEMLRSRAAVGRSAPHNCTNSVPPASPT